MFRFRTSLFASILCFSGLSAMAQGTEKPTDPQIADIAYTAGQIDVTAANLALEKTKNRAVRSFAEQMARSSSCRFGNYPSCSVSASQLPEKRREPSLVNSPQESPSHQRRTFPGSAASTDGGHALKT